MTINCSTGFRTAILGPQSFNNILGGGVIRVFSGPQPANADQPEQGTLLGLVTLSGQSWTPGNPAWGITYEVSGVAAVPSSIAPLIMSCTVSGTAGWFRMVGNAYDSAQLSLSLPRIDGSIGNGASPSDMVWGSTTLTAGTAYPLNLLTFILPPL